MEVDEEEMDVIELISQKATPVAKKAAEAAANKTPAGIFGKKHQNSFRKMFWKPQQVRAA